MGEATTKCCATCGRVFARRPHTANKGWAARRFCSQSCGRKAPTPLERRVERFWRKVDASAGFDACWPWLGATSGRGYGTFRWSDGRMWTASRVAYLLTHGDPGMLDTCHHCDNPPCCNPSHLFAGTRSENNLDSVAKGRWGDNRGKLTAQEAAAIRSAPGSHSALARTYGISANTVYRIKSGRIWKHA